MNQMIKNSKRILSNEFNSINNAFSSVSYKDRIQIVDLNRSYVPLSELSKHEPRHGNNDFNNITKISIIPTKEEMLSVRPPFLSQNVPRSFTFPS